MAGYLSARLGPEERLLYLGRLSLWTRVRAVLLSVLLCCLSLAWLMTGWKPSIPLAVKLLPFGLGLLVAVYVYLSLRSVEVAVTDQRIVVKTGLARIDTSEMFLNRVQGLEVAQSLAGRMLGYGTVKVRGASSDVLAVEGVSNPSAFRTAFYQAAHGARKRPWLL